MIWEEGITGILEGIRRLFFKAISSKLFDNFIIYVVYLYLLRYFVIQFY